MVQGCTKMVQGCTKMVERREMGRAHYTQAVECYERNMGTIATPMLAELVTSLVDEVGLEIFCKAAEIGGRNNAKGFKYVERVALNIKEGKEFKLEAPTKQNTPRGAMSYSEIAREMYGEKTP